VVGWIEERAAPRRTGPYHLVGARGRMVGVWLVGLKREPLRGERVHIIWLGPGAGWLGWIGLRREPLRGERFPIILLGPGAGLGIVWVI
jgi:hypothetical protein